MLTYRIGAKLSGLLLGALLVWPGLAGATASTSASSSSSKSASTSTSTSASTSSPSLAPVTGTKGPPTVQQDLTALHPVGTVVEVEQELAFAGTDPKGFKVSLIPGYQQLQIHYFDPTTNKTVAGIYHQQGNEVTLEPTAPGVIMGYLIPMPAKSLSWPAPVYYPTSVKIILASAGLTVPVVLNQDFKDMGSITSNVGPFERYASQPLQPNPNLVINVQRSAVATPSATGTTAPATASPLNAGVALGAIIAIVILVVAVFWYRNRAKSRAGLE